MDSDRPAIRPARYQTGLLSDRPAIRPARYQTGPLSDRPAIRPARYQNGPLSERPALARGRAFLGACNEAIVHLCMQRSNHLPIRPPTTEPAHPPIHPLAHRLAKEGRLREDEQQLVEENDTPTRGGVSLQAEREDER